MICRHTGALISLGCAAVLLAVALVDSAFPWARGAVVDSARGETTMKSSGASEVGASSAPRESRRRFGIVGIYVSPPAPSQSRYLDYYRACGYNYLEFCDIGFSMRPDLLPSYYSDLGSRVQAAQGRGFKVWILLLAGMKQWQGPERTGSAGSFSALNARLLEERLAYLRTAVRSLRQADGFVFFAGDPGGDPEGHSTVRDCIAFARRVQDIVRREAPRSRFAVNLWAVAEWAGYPSAFSVEFWRKQPELSKAVAEEPGLLGADCGVSFSLDSYYRSLALRCFSDIGEPPRLYPTPDDVRRLRERRVAPILGWPYFLVDEADDGFVTPNNVATGGQSQSEVRYIHAVVAHGRRLGLDGMVANAAYPEAEQLNVYAFAQLCRDARLTPGAVLDRFAAGLATPRTKQALIRVLRFIENHSSWHFSLPEKYRLPDLDATGVRSAQDALRAIEQVRPRGSSAVPLLETPTAYLARLRQRLTTIQAGEIGGPSPHYRSQTGP